MSVPPTAKELIRGIRHAEEDWDAVIDGETLAERVEAVLALPEEKSLRGPYAPDSEHWYAKGYNAALAAVRRALEGEP